MKAVYSLKPCKPLTSEQERIIIAEVVHARHQGFTSVRIRFENDTKIRVIPEREGKSRAA